MSIASIEEITHRNQALNQEMANFVALYESTLDNMASREQASRHYLEQSIQNFNEQISTIKDVLKDFEAIMTQAGAARWRLAAEEAMREGKAHAQNIQTATERLHQVVSEGCDRVDQVTVSAATRVADAARSLRIEDIQHLTDASIKKVERVSNNAIRRLRSTVKWMHWEKTALAVTVALIVGVVGGLFMNDELPWETHKKVAIERNAGQTLIKAWPNLTRQEHQRIQQASHM